MNVLILGAGGFIGSAIVKELAADKENQVIAYQRRISAPEENSGNISYIIDDFKNIEQHFKLIDQADVIIHGISELLPISENFKSEITNVISPTVALLDKYKNSDKHFIFISSGGSVYEEQIKNKKTITEDAHLQAYNFYGLSKRQLEDIFVFYRNKFSLSVTIIRPSNVFGYRKHNIGVNGIISTLINNATAGLPTTIWGAGTSVRDYIHVKDFSKALCKLAAKKITGIYNLSSGNAKSVNDIIECVNKYSLKKCIVQYKEDNYHFPEFIVLSNDKIKKVLPLDPQSDFEESIAELVAQYSNENKDINL